MIDNRERAVRRALQDIVDPEMGISIVDLGLVYAIDAGGEEVKVLMTLTHAACPMGAFIVSEVEERLAKLPFPVSVHLTFTPPWTPDLISEAGRVQLA